MVTRTSSVRVDLRSELGPYVIRNTLLQWGERPAITDGLELLHRRLREVLVGVADIGRGVDEADALRNVHRLERGTCEIDEGAGRAASQVVQAAVLPVLHQ